MSVATDYTTSELMVARIAECFTDDDQVCNGISSFIPVCAIQLAQRTHAPDLVWLPGSCGVGPAHPRMTDSTFEWPMWRDCVMYLDIGGELWDYIANPRLLRVFCVGAAQLDAHGNANNSVIGSYAAPRVRLPGTAGMGDMGSLDKRLVYWVPDHSPRSLVERVDFVSGIGFLEGHGARGRLGIGGGPELVVTNLCVFDFEPVSERMRLRSLHPGVTVDDVMAATGFAPVVPDHVATTTEPTAEQVSLIREIDPEGLSRRGVRAR